MKERAITKRISLPIQFFWLSFYIINIIMVTNISKIISISLNIKLVSRCEPRLRPRIG